MTRREILQYLSTIGLTTLVGGPLTSSTVSALDVVVGYQPDGTLNTLNQTQATALESIADIIIPATDTPGAADIGICHFIDHMLTHWMAKKQVQGFLVTLDFFLEKTQGFLSKQKSQQIAIVQKLDNEMQQDQPLNEFYRTIKKLTLVGYYTSRVGATIELAYDPVPGPYRPVTTDQYNRNWAM